MTLATDYLGLDALLSAGAKLPELTDDLEASEAVHAVIRRYVDKT